MFPTGQQRKVDLSDLKPITVEEDILSQVPDLSEFGRLSKFFINPEKVKPTVSVSFIDVSDLEQIASSVKTFNAHLRKTSSSFSS